MAVDNAQAKNTFYDDEMIASLELLITYLQSQRGRQALRRRAQANPTLAKKLQALQQLPWEQFHEPCIG